MRKVPCPSGKQGSGTKTQKKQTPKCRKCRKRGSLASSWLVWGDSHQQPSVAILSNCDLLWSSPSPTLPTSRNDLSCLRSLGVPLFKSLLWVDTLQCKLAFICQKQRVATKCAFFFVPSKHKLCLPIFLENAILTKNTFFLHNHPKTLFFIFFSNLSFSTFSSFLCKPLFWHLDSLQKHIFAPLHTTVRVKIITGSLVTLENLFPENYRYRYRLEIRTNYHCRYRLGPHSHPFMSIDSQLPSRKSFELISPKLLLPLPSWNVLELER